MRLQLQSDLKALCGSTIGWHHQKVTEFKTVIHTLHMHIVLWSLDSKQINRSVDLPVCTKTDHTSLFSNRKITFGLNEFKVQWINIYALIDRPISMCSNMILTIESIEFIVQWINIYALIDRPISMCSNMILTIESKEFIVQWINTYALRQTDFNVF